MSDLPTPRTPDLFEPVLSTEAMREADRRTIEEFGLPSRVLMETAARGVADALEVRFGAVDGRRVLVVCGRGNNGGDGFALARVLHARGGHLKVIAMGAADDLTEDAAANLRLLEEVASHTDRLSVEVRQSADDLDPYWPEIVVDALLGVGVTGSLRDPIDALARWINACPAPVVAIDLPTGLDSETGRAADGAVRADLTVTVAAHKVGLLFNDGPELAGQIEVVDIGIPTHLLDEAATMRGSGLRTTDAGVRRLVPTRPRDAHKYTAGRVLAIAGSHQFPGAAVLTATAAARVGAGAVVVATTQRARPILEAHLVEVMTTPLPETEDGTLAYEALDELLERAGSADAVVLGPGLGRHAETQRLVRALVERLETPTVIDADALTALAGHTDLVARHADGRMVLTPHLGELRRLTGDDDLEAERPLALAGDLAGQWNCVLVIKGMPSVVGTPDGRRYVSSAVSPALATAGTGDVLAGMTVGLIAQGLSPTEAAVCALHLGGRAAERYASERAPHTLIASDLLAHLPHVLASFG
jgi:ADP-dependent NAD(P)H-hydrate dehydratase / NAD(P)H-hydrate epimerase